MRISRRLLRLDIRIILKMYVYGTLGFRSSYRFDRYDLQGRVGSQCFNRLRCRDRLCVLLAAAVKYSHQFPVLAATVATNKRFVGGYICVNTTERICCFSGEPIQSPFVDVYLAKQWCQKSSTPFNRRSISAGTAEIPVRFPSFCCNKMLQISMRVNFKSSSHQPQFLVRRNWVILFNWAIRYIGKNLVICLLAFLYHTGNCTHDRSRDPCRCRLSQHLNESPDFCRWFTCMLWL